MNTTVGQRTYTASPQAFLPGRPAERFNAAELTAREIDVAVRDIVAHAFDRASDILQARRADLDKGAELLLSKETLTAEDYPPIRPLAGERDSTTDAGSAVAAFKSMT
jgi:cell division protease FtsH